MVLGIGGFQEKMRRGQIQLRGNISWKARRSLTILRYGYDKVLRLPIIFGNAIPKCGSKLLFNILRGLQELGPFIDTGLNEIKPFFQGDVTSQTWINKQLDALQGGDIRFGYLYGYDENIKRLTQDNWASFLIIRDPRDQVISEIFFAMEIHRGHALHAFLHAQEEMGARISALLHGIDDGAYKRVGIRDHYERFLPWMEEEGICIIRYEDLIGRRETELRKIIKHLSGRGFTPDITQDQAIKTIERQMEPSKSETFRKGQSGGWRRHFTQKNTTEFNEVAGDLLARLGYEGEEV